MAEVIQGAVEDVMDQEIRYFAGLVYARVEHRRDSSNKEADIGQLRTRIRSAITDWRDNDLSAAGDPNL